jgi:hypothetical protein
LSTFFLSTHVKSQLFILLQTLEDIDEGPYHCALKEQPQSVIQRYLQQGEQEGVTIAQDMVNCFDDAALTFVNEFHIASRENPRLTIQDTSAVALDEVDILASQMAEILHKRTNESYTAKNEKTTPDCLNDECKSVFFSAFFMFATDL